jgi:serine phosphatase RsbU (regulator of sigma subunit)
MIVNKWQMRSGLLLIIEQNPAIIVVIGNFSGMKTDKEKLVKLLCSLFEKELALEMAEFPIMHFPAGMVVGREGDEIQLISIVLKGSVRAVRIDKSGDEILIYNMDKMQSCIISITSAMRNRKSSSIYAITNEESTLLSFPKAKTNEWMGKYESWRSFTIELYENRLYELLDNHQTVKQQKSSILESIRYAKRIQNAVLPPAEIIHSMLPDHFILYKPRDIVSGDYYWMTQIGKKTIVIVADCTGHGVPGAFMSMLGITLLNQNVKNYEFLHANEILDELRDNIILSLRQDGTQDATKDGMDMSLLIFDFDKNELEFAGANSSMYIIRNNELIMLEADKMPVGIHLGDGRSFTRKEFRIQKADRFYAFSDGYIDQFGGNQNKKFLRKNFIELLLKIHKKPMTEQKEILDQTVENWRGKLEQVDDILVLGVRV